jgi:hypothetical protein|tara:strand:- start:619 stop:894 length:276 start_codon:yes stop_codon:yes gene_type:complete
MVVKILGILDVVTALILFLFLNFNVFQSLLIIFTIFLILKSLLTIKDLFSIIDLLVGFVIILNLVGMSNSLVWFGFYWLFFKGLFSLISSV